MTWKRRLVVLMGVVPLASCNLSPATMCPQDVRPALLVDVRDSSTNVQVGPGARIIARDGWIADTVLVPLDADNLGPYRLAEERASNYTVTVERYGYRTWSRSGIQVVQDECHVHTVRVTARLQP